MSGAKIKIDHPKRIRFECPFCGEDNDTPYDDVEWATGDMSEGGWVICDECREDVMLSGEVEIE